MPMLLKNKTVYHPTPSGMSFVRAKDQSPDRLILVLQKYVMLWGLNST